MGAGSILGTMFAPPVLGLCLFLPGQDPAPAIEPAAPLTDLDVGALASSPFDRVVAIALSAADPTLSGHGPCRWIDYVAEFSGALHVWTKVEGALDTFLRIEDDAGTLLVEDDDSGGTPNPYVMLEVERGNGLAIAVSASQAGAGGRVDVHLVAAPETESTRAEALLAEQELAEIVKLRVAGDLSNARARAVALVEHLPRVEGGSVSELVAQQAWLVGFETHALALLRPTERVWRTSLLHCLRTLPLDHPDLQRVRLNLAATIKLLGDRIGARVLEEEVLEVFSRTLPADHMHLQLVRLNLATTVKDLDVPRARALEEVVLEVFSRTLPRDHPDLQMARGNLASSLKLQGHLADARALMEAVVEVYSRTLTEDHPDLQRARGNLADTMRALGDLAGARALQGAVLEVFSRTLPEDHPDLQRARQALALTIRDMGDLAGARALFERVLEVDSRSLPDDHPNLQAAREYLAITSYKLGDLAEARVLQEMVLEVRARTMPADHPELQTARLNLALTIKDMGDLAGARALEEAVLEVSSRLLPDDHPDLQTARLNLAGTISALGDLAGARTLEEQVLEVFSRTMPADHPYLQAARLNLAITIKTLGDLAGARELQEQVLEVWSRTLPADHPDLQKARQSLALTIRDLGDLAGARELQEQVLEVRSRTLPADHPELQKARLNLASTMHALGNLDGARALAETALEVFSRTLPEEHLDLQKARQDLALMMFTIGDLAGARVLLEQVLKVSSRTLPADHPDLQTARGNLALTIKALGDLGGARALEEQVLEVFSRTMPADHPDTQAVRLNFAGTLKALGDLSGARALCEQVLEVRSRTLPAEHPDLLATRGNLAATMYALGDYGGARALFEEVLEVRSRTLPAYHPDLQGARLSLAATMSALGDQAGARALEEAVLEVFALTRPVDHPDFQMARANLALTLARERTSSKGGEGERLEGREVFARVTGDFTRSLARSAREALLSGSSREAEERCVNLSKDIGRALSFAEGLSVFGRNEELEREAFLSSEDTRGAPLASASLARRAAAHPRHAELREEIHSASVELARLAQGGASADEFDRARSRRDMAERELVGLAKEMLGEVERMLGLELAPLSGDLANGDVFVGYRRYECFRVEADGKDSSTESLCAFVLRSGKRLHRIEFGPIEPIEEAVEAWRTAVGVGAADSARGVGVEPATIMDLGAAGDRLRRMVLDPLADHLEGAERIVVALDDVLHLVPLAALPAGGAWGTATPSSNVDPSRLVGDVVRIEIRTSIMELLGRGPRPLTGDLVVVGGVDYEGRATSQARVALAAITSAPNAPRGAGLLRDTPWGTGFTPLEATGEEARGIAALMQASLVEVGGIELLEGAHATRESLVALAPRARFLHIATHGWFAPESIRSMLDPEPLEGKTGFGLRMDTAERVKGMAPMLLCGLALAGANLPENELGRAPGLMTAEEISTLDLSNCELAVLSACDTNVGERRAGQGVASLQRALHMAGARSVITSLWKVPDEATKELMLDFYRRIWVLYEPKHEALWAAKKKLRDAVDERGEPKYTTRDWAAWVLTGQQD